MLYGDEWRAPEYLSAAKHALTMYIEEQRLGDVPQTTWTILHVNNKSSMMLYPAAFSMGYGHYSTNNNG